MARQIFTTDRVTLWFNNETLMGLSSVAIWRIVWGNPDRVIICYDINDKEANSLLQSLLFNLYMYYQDVGRLDTLNGQKLLLKFEDCKPHRRWIPQPMAINGQSKIIQEFIELTCKIIEDSNG